MWFASQEPYLKPAFSWPGGKAWAAKYVLPRVPNHTCYCEPFAGGLAILLAKEPSKLEVINDINSDLVNFYRCVRFHLDELIKELQFLLNSREEFNDLKKQRGLTDIQRAARWFRIQTLSFGGDGDSFAVARTNGGGANKSRKNLLDRISELSDRLDRVVIESLDWSRCLSLYDSDETFFFIDSPYTGGRIKNYAAWSADDLRVLRSALDMIKGKYLLTINDCDAAREIFSGLSITRLNRKRGIANKDGRASEYAELLISSQNA